MERIDDLEVYNQLLLSSNSVALFGHQDPINEDIDEQTKAALGYALQKASLLLSSFVQLADVVRDMEITFFMLSRYPWHGTKVDRRSHLELNWFLYQNLCYKFKEKQKLVYNTQLSAAKAISIDQPDWLKEELKISEKLFGSEIRDRGNTVHNWNVKNKDIELFSMVHALHKMKSGSSRVAVPEPLLDLVGFYTDAKYSLKQRARTLHQGAISSVTRILVDHQPNPISIVNAVDDLLVKANAKEIRLTIR